MNGNLCSCLWLMSHGSSPTVWPSSCHSNELLSQDDDFTVCQPDGWCHIAVITDWGDSFGIGIVLIPPKPSYIVSNLHLSWVSAACFHKTQLLFCLVLCFMAFKGFNVEFSFWLNLGISLTMIWYLLKMYLVLFLFF